MMILGIDPGSRKTGYAVVRIDHGASAAVQFGTIALTDLSSIPEKLVKIFEEINKLFDEYPIESVAVEAGFYGKNAQSAYKLGYARSAAVLVSALKRIEVVEYSPRKVKQAVTGHGNASKLQVKYMVKRVLHIGDGQKIREDEADACAVAICHAQNCGHGATKYKSWKDFIDHNKNLVVRSKMRSLRA